MPAITNSDAWQLVIRLVRHMTSNLALHNICQSIDSGKHCVMWQVTVEIKPIDSQDTPYATHGACQRDPTPSPMSSPALGSMGTCLRVGEWSRAKR